MKKIIYTLIAIFLSTSFFAQEIINHRESDPEKGFNYKTIIKNNGVIIANQTLDIRFTIYDSDPNDGGTQMYQETHTTTTSANGIAIVKMGQGTPTNSWNSIYWDADNYYKTEYNLGSGYVDMGTQRFDFVPVAEWARVADTAEYAFHADHVNFEDIEFTPTTLAGYGITDADPSTTNELQNLSVTGNQLSISNGNTVTLPTGTTYTAGTGINITGSQITNTGDTNASDDFSGNYNDLTNKPTQISVFTNDSGYLTTEQDGSVSNELQTLSIASNQLSISNGNTVTLPTGTTYTAGTGINITGSQITNTGDTNASDDFSGNYNDLTNKPTQISVFTNDSGYLTTEQDGSVSNELQTLSIASNQLSISNGNTVTLPTGTTYTAGTGISISNGIITNTGDTNAANDFDGNYNSLSNLPIQFLDAGGNAPTSISQDVHRMSGVALGNNQVQKGKLDIRVNGANTDIPENVGIGIANSSATATTQKGVDVALTGASTGEQYGFFSELSGTTSLNQTGTSNKLSGYGAGPHTGTYNYLLNSGTGIQTGVRNDVSTTNDNWHYGVYNQLTGTGSGEHLGTYNRLGGTGTGIQYGNYNEIVNTANNLHIGNYNHLHGTGTGRHYGNRNFLSGTGTGVQYGTDNYINNSNNTMHYGVYNELDGAGSGSHYGVVNQLSGTGTGSQYGTSNKIDNSGNGPHYAIRNDMTGSGIGVHAAVYSTLSGSGSGNQYGVKSEITNTSTGQHYGFNAILSGSGNGNKYGSYNLINPAAGGTHYAVYGSATKIGSYAGYFDGDVKVSNKILSEDTGNADMKAYIYGKINTSSTGATIVANASSGGFTIERTGLGIYTVTFANSPGYLDKYMVLGTMDNLAKGFISVYNFSSYFKILTYDIDGNAADRDFTFVVYKK